MIIVFLNKLQYSVNINFICTGETKKLCDSLYCGDLERNLEHVRGRYAYIQIGGSQTEMCLQRYVVVYGKCCIRTTLTHETPRHNVQNEGKILNALYVHSSQPTMTRRVACDTGPSLSTV